MSSSIPIRVAGAAAALALLTLPARAQQLVRELPYVIDEPGSYLVVDDLTGAGGILVVASHVTLDLDGHTLTGRPGNTSHGIEVRGPRADVTIRNGILAQWGKVGLQAQGASGAVFDDLRLFANGLCGLRGGQGALVQGVVARDNLLGSGIVVGAGSRVMESSSFGNAGWGVEAGPGSVVTGLAVYDNGGGGILAEEGALVAGNAVRGNGFGYRPGNGADPRECSVVTLAGVAARGPGVRVEDNTLSGNRIGLQLLTTGNVVRANVVSGNEDNYDLLPGNQLEILLSELPESIDWPATVVLAGSLQGVPGSMGLTVTADGVTIDLAGHGLVGVPGSTCGIYVPDVVRDLVVKNGFLSDWGGCGLRGGKASGSRIMDLVVKHNGESGLRIGAGSVVSGVVARGNALDGILAQQDCVITQSAATGNGNDGINVGDHSAIVDCVASENALFGFRVGTGSKVESSTASSNSLGIAVSAGSTVLDCVVSFNVGVGVRGEGGCRLVGNTAHANGIGIALLSGMGTRVEANHVTANTQFGIRVYSAGNLVVGNSACANAIEYSVEPGNTMGEVLDMRGVPSFNSDAWANLVF